MKLTPQYLAEVVTALNTPPASNKGVEKRRAARMEVQGNVVVAPLDIDGAVGRSFTAITRDISFVGIGLLQATQMATGQAVVVRLPRGGRQALFMHCNVMHTRALADGLFVVGVEFVRVADGVTDKDLLGRSGETDLVRVRQLILS